MQHNEQDLSEESIMNPSKKQSNISADKNVLDRDFAVPDAFLFKAGIFTEVLNEILQTAHTEPTAAGNVYEALSSPFSVYTAFQTVLSDISPRTVSFTEHTTTNNTTNGTFALSNTQKGVEITKWKELTFFLPSELKTFSSKDFSPFTVQFLGTKVDYSELPHNIFSGKPTQICPRCYAK